MWWAHLRQHLVQPLQRAVEVDLDPTGCAGDVLTMVLGAPALHKAHTDCAHLGQLVNSLKTVVNGLAEKGGKLLVVEDLQRAAGWDFTHCGGMEVVMDVTVTTLHKDTALAEAFGEYLSTDVVHVDACNKNNQNVTEPHT